MADDEVSGPAAAPREGTKAGSAPPLGPVLRYYGPFLALGLVGVGVIGAYARLSLRLDALEARLDAVAVASSPGAVEREPAAALAAAGAALAAANDEPPVAPSGGLAPSGGVAPAPADAPPPVETVRGEAPVWPCDVHLDEDAVRGVIGREGRAVFACIEARRTARPDLAGRLDVRLRVGGTGAVEAVHVGGVEDEELVACVGHAVLAWTFPSPGAERCAVVSAPFVVGP